MIAIISQRKRPASPSTRAKPAWSLPLSIASLRLLFAAALGLAAACASPESDDTGGSTGALSCEHGTYSPCVCSDGSMGTQLCAHDTSGFETCMCGGDEDPSGIATTDDPPGTSDDGIDPSTEGGTTVAETTAMTSTAETTGTVDTGTTAGLGEPPTATINHPGIEDRQVGVPIPFIGVADDPEDGPLAGASMQWTDDLEGMIGQGEDFNAALDILGEHTVTLTAMDSDGNIGEASITFNIVP